ncbi:MAG TPA: DUF1254 domain-containing protein [Streptosporangiaceae bacterium]
MSGSGRDGVSAETLRSISTPDRVESRLGPLEFVDGAPTEATAAVLYDNLDFMHGVEAFINSFPGASLAAMHRGFLSIGVEDNDVLAFPELMDSASLFLTANCDTMYFISFVDLSDGPMVIDLPALGPPTGILGAVDDMWFGWVTDTGLPGPDRGDGGRYLIVGPGYDGPLPDNGFFVSHCRTTRAIWFGRAFMVDNDPAPAVEAIRNGLRIYPYQPGGVGTSVATFLAGAGPFAPDAEPAPTRFVDAVHTSFNTIPPNDDSYWDLINEVVQTEPAGAGNPETLGLLASVGIVKGQPFAPDARMRKILSEAVAVGNATARTEALDPRDQEGWAYYPGSAWFNMMWVGYEFLTPPPMITPNGVEQSPSDGARKINARIAFFYAYTGITPAMCMRLTGIGSQYLFAARDSRGDYFDGARSYRLTLPPGIPESRFWSVLVYDRQTRSMLQTDQLLPDVSSQRGTIATNPDGTTDVYFGPTAPDGKESNWLQTVPGKGWFPILRLYNPLQPFFDKTWRPSEIEPT